MNYLPNTYQGVYITGSGFFLPGEPVNNDSIDRYIAPLNKASRRIKERILKENGIQQRYYAVDHNGKTLYTAVQMAAAAISQCLQETASDLASYSLLATGSAGGDVLMPGLANMLQGELAAPPLETHSHHGICAAGVHALKDAANHIEAGFHQRALVTAVEHPSQLFKRSRFEPLSYQVDFDAHFLRWMLSDGAGALSLDSQPNSKGMTLQLQWIHSKSYSGDYPVCMQMGLGKDEQGYLQHSSFSEAEAAGKMLLRQDIRLLPQLFEVAIHEYADLVKQGYIDPQQVDHFLCHYSSQRLGEQAQELMSQAGLSIPREKWYSNLTYRGNTGSASIFIMLAEFLRNQPLRPGQRIFCFVPESGRFTVSFFMLKVVDNRGGHDTSRQTNHILPPHAPTADTPLVQKTLQELAAVWHDYRSELWRTPLVQTIVQGSLSLVQYREWMAGWIPQVREGSHWMRTAMEQLPESLSQLCNLMETHSLEEQNDYQILYSDYLVAGGRLPLEDLKRNPGGEALNAFMYSLANGPKYLGLLGGIYIIEGTGQRIIPVLLPKLRQQLPLTADGFRFLRYHGENDIRHLQRWLDALNITLELKPSAAEDIVYTARQVAQLYRLQWDHIL